MEYEDLVKQFSRPDYVSLNQETTETNDVRWRAFERNLKIEAYGDTKEEALRNLLVRYAGVQ